MFTLELGPKQQDPRAIRPHDWHHEILVNFTDGREASLGWLTCLCDPVSAKVLQWRIIDTKGNELPGMQRPFTTTTQALSAATVWLSDYLTPPQD